MFVNMSLNSQQPMELAYYSSTQYIASTCSICGRVNRMSSRVPESTDTVQPLGSCRKRTTEMGTDFSQAKEEQNLIKSILFTVADHAHMLEHSVYLWVIM